MAKATLTTKKKATAGKKAPATPGSKAGSTFKCTNWTSWEDQMPPGPATLHVTGKCVFPTYGYKVKLKKAAPQGFNPAILLLEKVVRKPTGIVIQTPQRVEVNYKQRIKAGQFKQVTILPDGKTIKVKIVT